MSLSAATAPRWGDQPPTTLAAILRWRAEHEADRLAYTFLPDSGGAEPSHTYGSLDARARTIAAALLRQLAPGDRALLLYPPGLDFVEAFFGCLYAGVIAVPAYPPRNRGHLPRLRALLADSGGRLALTHSKTIEAIRQQIVGQSEWAGVELRATDELTAPGGAPAAGPLPEAGALAFLQYTSGSTGNPKGVMVTHRNLVYATHYIQAQSAMETASVSVSWLPSFHDMGLVDGVLMPLYVGCHAVLLSPVGFVQRPACWLEAITRFRGTHGGSPNFGYELCVRKIPPERRAAYDLSSWNCAYNGAEPLRASTLRDFAAAFAPCGLRPETLYPTYGLAEATLMVSGCEMDRVPVARRVLRTGLEAGRFLAAPEGAAAEDVFELVSSGKAILETRLAIAELPGGDRRAGPAVIGEVWIAGPTVCAGYWQRPVETAATFGGQFAGEEGRWLRTGDLGYLDEAGELFICGRVKDLIIVRGRNHYPQDLEETAGSAHPSVRPGGAAAFAVEEDGEERLIVAQEVDRTELKRVNPAAVGAAIAAAIAAEHEVSPKEVILLKPSAVPRTSSGKVRRAEARRQYLAGELEEVGRWGAEPGAGTKAGKAAATPAAGGGSLPGFRAGPAAAQQPAATAAQVAAWLQAQLAAKLKRPPDQIDPATAFTAYGLDSAAHLELSGDLQAWLGRPVPPMALYDYPDIARLSRHLGWSASPPARSDLQPSSDPVAAGGSGASGLPGAGWAESGTTRSAGDAIAILGLGLRLPGGADSPAAFWELLTGRVDAITPVPAGRWPRSECSLAQGGFVAGIDRFDAEFFGISPREAAALDPQQRLLLETTWHALEDAGLDPTRLAGSETGVFIGISTQDYSRRTLPSGAPDRIDAHSGTGSALSAAAGRISYFFDWRGPAVATDTACSSSLVAVHQACRALAAGECTLAVAGGVNAVLAPELGINFGQAGMLAPDGRCKTFDAAADGYVRSEGCGVVVLKRLRDAQAEGDPIWAVIRGSAVGQDGRSNGLTAPNGPAQERVIAAALRRSALPASAVGYVETHGTGTALGDPIEGRALGAALGSGRSAEAPLLIGSVKTNLGHLEAAAGIASLAKVVLALRHGQIPPNLHFAQPTPHLDWARLGLRVVAEPTPWAAAGGSLRHAGVSAFGFTGTNAHLIVGEAEDAAADAARGIDGLQSGGGATRSTLLISAKTEEAVRELAQRWARWLEAAEPGAVPAALAAAAEGRASLPFRLLAAGENAAALAAAARAAEPAQVPPAPPGPVFLFTGQGSQSGEMGRELYAGEPAYRAAVERCLGALDAPLAARLRTALTGPPAEAEALLAATAVAQPALFIVEWALVELLASWAIRPAAVLGHSIGEFVAACAAGVFTPEAGVKLVAARGRMMQALPAGGGMLALRVDAGSAQATAAAAQCPGVVVAAINAPEETVLAGPLDELARVAKRCAALGIPAQPLRVSHAFHSPLMEPMLTDFSRAIAATELKPASLPFVSALGGRSETDPSWPAHWLRHVLQPVKFAEALRSFESRPYRTFVEIGPRPVLTALAHRTWAGPEARWLATLRPGRGEAGELRAMAGELWLAGLPVSGRAFRLPGARRLPALNLPLYPFARVRHWIEVERVAPNAPAPTAIEPEFNLRAAPAPAQPRAPAGPRFGIMFFNGLGDAGAADPYRFLLDAARFADQHGFSSVWVPERHYTRFGGLYPNPSVIGAALSRHTRSLRLMAGSLVAPLHHPLRIAEDWAAIDNLSGGRAGISLASGWNPDDFAANPGAYEDRHDAVFRAAEQVRRLWRGEPFEAVSGSGRPVAVTVYPRPVQPELPLWITAAGNPRTFERAGAIGANVLTHLLDQDPAQLGEKIAIYRGARARAGHDPAAGQVTVMVHTFLGPDDAAVRAAIREPYCAFLKANLHLLEGLAVSRGQAAALGRMAPADLDDFVGFIFERFYRERALFGTPAAAGGLVDKLVAAGANEIACLLDFGAPASAALAALPCLDELRARFAGAEAAAGAAAPSAQARATAGTGGAPAPRDEALPAGLLHQVIWREAAPAAEKESGPPRGRGKLWLLLDDGSELGRRLASALAARGDYPVKVERAPAFARRAADDDESLPVFAVNPLAPADFRAVLAELPRERLEGIIHLWSPPAAEPTAPSVQSAAEVALASLLHLAQALEGGAGWPQPAGASDRAEVGTAGGAKAGWGQPAPPRIWLVTRGALGAVGSPLAAQNPAAAPAWGLGRVLAVEHSELWGGAIDLDVRAGAEWAEADALLGEWDRAEPDDQLAFRGGRRWVPRLVPAPAAPFAPITLRPDATYLITGGLGALGRRVAQWLVERGARHLILTGLHPLPDRAAWTALPADTPEAVRQKVESIRAMESLGASVRAEAVDVCDRAAMAALLRQGAAAERPLAGVFHLAGLPENRTAHATVFAEHSAVLGPKIAGAWIVHELTRGLPLDYWVAFSSISAVWGSRGQPLYAGANYFLDALGELRRAAGLPATIVNWGPWADGGMVISAADQAQLARFGLRPTAPRQGMAALEYLLSAGRPAAVVATVDWSRFKELFAARGRNGLFAELGGASDAALIAAGPTPFFAELAGLEAEQRLVRICAWLQSAIARTLGWPDGRLPAPGRGFFDLGMDSLLAIEVKNRLQADLGVPLRATVVFNYPTITALAAYLAGLLPPPPDSAGPADDELARLLEAEARSVLEKNRP